MYHNSIENVRIPPILRLEQKVRRGAPDLRPKRVLLICKRSQV